ncbi:hypothetical protein tb265_33360 [Gemmatimonadetes bacterium T265]|nr:hypothetical protein tb265_33360 [Gemmatimonadetes bacterium T265]
MTTPVGKVRKSVRIDPAVLDRARAILGTTTDSETIEHALDLVAFKREVIAGIHAVAGKNLWTDVFGDGTARSSTGHGIVALAGTIPPEDLRRMEQAVEEGCERVDESGWDAPEF